MSYKDEPHIGEIDAAITAGMLMGEPRMLAGDELAVVLVPQGAKLEQIDLRAIEQKYAEHPLRKTGSRALATAAAFIAYVNAHKDSATSIYAGKLNTTFSAVFNDHERNIPDQQADGSETLPGLLGRPGHGDFRAAYACPLSVEWKRWTSRSQHEAEPKKGMPQAEFMQFLEDNLLDITKPDSAMLLGAVRSFEAHQDVKFKSATRLQDGTITFNYQETINEVAQDGKLSMPEGFEITIPVFEGGTRYIVEARLRYRIQAGGLILWYELVRPHKVIEYAFNTVRDEIMAAVGQVPVYDV